MEGAGAFPTGGVSAPELGELMTKSEGPFATVYLATDPDVENASQRSVVRWKDARRELAGAGAPQAVLDAIEPFVGDAHTRGACLAAVADASGGLHVEHGPATRELVRWAALPTLLPLLRWRQDNPPHVVVLADRHGADILGLRLEEPPLQAEAGGEEWPIRKVSAGGWSQRRVQNRAENTWEHNAKDVAEEVATVADRIGAGLIVAAGDVRALQLLRGDLPKEILDRYREVSGTRSPDGSAEFIPDEVSKELASFVREETDALLAAFREERGQSDLAADGAGRVVQALSRAQVEVLLVNDDLEDDRSGWFGPDPTHVATDAAALAAVGVEHPKEGRLLDVLVRAALGTGATVRIIPRSQGPRDDVGAILRYR
jgi:Bacterial archaeo-eukaryotic release factor family 2